MYCYSNGIESEVFQGWFLIQQPSLFETKMVNGHCISNSVLQDYIALYFIYAWGSTNNIMAVASGPAGSVLPGPVLPVVAFMPAHAQVINNERWPGRCSNQVNNQQLQRRDSLTHTSVNHCRRCDLEAHPPDHFKGASYGPEYSALLMTLKVHKSKDGCSYKHHSCGYWKPKLYPVETAFLAVFYRTSMSVFIPWSRTNALLF